jgi:O-antigen ligase
MQSMVLHHTVNHRTLRRFGILIFVCILILHGTYFRNRPTVAVPKMDWLILAQLLTCATSFMVGIVLLPKNVAWGFGAKILLLYVLATGISAANSPYPLTVFGYFILLSGASVLVFALVYHAQNINQLEKIEKIWFFTVSVLIVKDALTGLLIPSLRPPDEVVRLGLGITHANQLSFFAGLLFWMSFRYSKGRYHVILWLWRIFLLYVIIAAKSRVSIAGFITAGLCYYFFSTRDYLKRWMVISCTGFLAVSFMLSLSFGQNWACSISDYMKRGQDVEELITLTGRTYIWQNIANQSLESPIIGHGYGVSRLAMEPLPNADFQPAHCHNELLEVFFTTGLLGLVPFIGMLMYNLKWIRYSSRLQHVFPKALALDAMCLSVMLLVLSVFEIPLSGKLTPVQVLFLFYLMTLDREGYLRRVDLKTRNSGREVYDAERRLRA